MISIYMTHDPRLYINVDLDPVHKLFQTADGHKIQTQGVSTIALDMLLEGKIAYVYLHNIYYYPELDSNLLILNIFEKKEIQFDRK